MRKVIEIKGVPVKLWLETIEEGVLAQAEHVASFLLSISISA